ncbi:hypothetical protein ACFWAF_12470 [Streptomyces microflavus]|uniref:hypothetical protein n=1 Tax=Streptomyces microflavus TaxID=1919 RepID=UPI0036514699
MSWKDVRAGALSVLDPTGAVLPAHGASTEGGSSLSERLVALNTALGAIADSPPSSLSLEAAKAQKKLSSLRLAAVMGSFFSAALSAVLAVFSLAADTRWPVLVISLLSVFASVAITAFLGALRLSLARRMRHDSLYAEFQRLASQRVWDLETARLVRLSETNPDAARTLLLQIVTEYEQATKVRSGAQNVKREPVTARQLMQTAGPSNPVRKTLTMMVSDLQERRA